MRLALLLLALALPVAAAVEQDPEALGRLFELASSYEQQGRLSQAVELHSRVLAARQAALDPRHPDTLQSRLALARTLSAAGRSAEAAAMGEDSVKRALDMWGAKSREAADAMEATANILVGAGRLAEALALAEEVLRIRRGVLFEGHPATLIALGNVASMSRALGRPERAAALEREILQQWVAMRGERSPAALIALTNLAGSYVEMGRPDEALPLQERALRWTSEVHGDRSPQALRAMMNLARTYGDLGRHDEALALGRKALESQERLHGELNSDARNAMANLAVLEDAAGRHSEALALRERVLKARSEALGPRHPHTLASTADLIGSYARAGRTADALALAPGYVAGAEQQRSQPGLSADDRQGLFRAYSRAYRLFSLLHGSLGQADEGFRLSELSKARTLLEGMAAQRGSRSGVLPPAERRRLDDLEQKIGDLTLAAARATDAQFRQETEAQRNALVREEEALRARLRQEHPKYAQLSDVRLLGANDLRGLVGPEAVVVSYVVATDRDLSLVGAWWTDSSGTVQFRDLGQIRRLPELVEAVRRGSGLPGGPVGRDLVERKRLLAQRLLEPLAAALRGKRQWIISPDGPLALVPFEVLPWGERGQPAAASADIQYTQSLSALTLGKAKQEQYASLQGRRALFAMGNADYQPGAQGPRSRNRGEAPPLRIVRDLRELDADWPNLPGTETELRSVAALFGKSATVRMGRQATEHDLQALNASGELARYRLLLFAAHGYLSPTEPYLSSLVLGLLNRAPGTDGYVTAAEWPGYDLRSDVVVLSACETALGTTISGEGVMGLPFALFVAGNVNTILSLWPVQDDVTAAFMKALFTKLEAGMPPAKALAETKREFLQSPRRDYASPSAWAAFILIGPGGS